MMGYRDEIRGDTVRVATEPGALQRIADQFGQAFDVEPRLEQKIQTGIAALRTELHAETTVLAQQLRASDDQLGQRIGRLETGAGAGIDALRKEFDGKLASLRKELLDDMKGLLADQSRKTDERLQGHERRLEALERGGGKPPKSNA